MQVSTTWRSTVNRWIADACGSSRIRSHSGSTASSAPVSSRVSHTGSSPGPAASNLTRAWRASAGHGHGRGGHSATSRVAVAVGETLVVAQVASGLIPSLTPGTAVRVRLAPVPVALDV